MDCTALTAILEVILLVFAQLSKTTEASRDGPEPASREIFYRMGDRLNFTCQDHPSSTPLHVKWYMNGIPINKSTTNSDVKIILAWDVAQFKHGELDFNSNEMTLVARGGPPTSTLICTVKGRYKHNIVKVYNLVWDIDRRPGPMPGLSEQKCPLYPTKQLTLSCEDAIKYRHISNWIWEKNDEKIPNEHTSQLTVTKKGTYACFYQTGNHGAQRLLKFKVKGKKSLNQKIWHGDWAFCKYTDNMANSPAKVTGDVPHNS